jgi:hypothetical protein
VPALIVRRNPAPIPQNQSTPRVRGEGGSPA